MRDWERYEIRPGLDPGERIWVAEIPQLQGCRAYAASREEALKALYETADAYVRIAQEDGEVLPPPIASPPAEHSGRFLMRVSPSLHRSLSLRARLEGVSLNKLCTELLAWGLGARSTASAAQPIYPASAGQAPQLQVREAQREPERP
jgi:predicted HicB family RNase H-like nuclease